MPIKRKVKSIISAVAVIIIGCAFLFYNLIQTDKNAPAPSVDGECIVRFLDVGQGDSILISCGEDNLLIDAGENNRGDEVVVMLKDLGVTELDYVIGTHAHSDHIGGLDIVLDSIKVENIILSDLPDSMIPTTKTYTDLLTAIEKNRVNLIAAEVGQSYKIGDAELRLLAPLGDYSDLNNYSIVTKLTFGNNSFLFTGDAEAKSEKDILQSGADISADVIKIGHHGSETSSSKLFIEAVDPEYSVISVGRYNSYGHPDVETLSFLEKLGSKIYRTDLNGTVTATSDGEKITFKLEKE